MATYEPEHLPGSDGYDPEKDDLVVGWQLAYGDPGKTPYDFLTNPTTGLRQDQSNHPNASIYISLKQGVDRINIPGLYIWDSGKWLWDMISDGDLNPDDFSGKVRVHVRDYKGGDEKYPPSDIYGMWVVSGETLPGNYLYRVYDIPNEEAGHMEPEHPSLWKDGLKKGTYYKGTSTFSTSSVTSNDNKIPLGVRIRCTGCGHWFRTDDLPGHAQVCGKGDEVDWALMCCDECGCTSLDEATTAKPGFPRQKEAANDSQASPQ